MKNCPGVSVIIPFYNSADYLERCLQSVVNQTYTNLEIIIVDDGSTDESAKICMRYVENDNRIVYIRRQNKGLGESRNLGLRLMSNDYVTFLDSDDWFEFDFIELVMNKILDADADIGLCDIYYVDSANMCKEVSEVRLPKTAVSVGQNTSIVNKCRTFAWGKIYKKALFVDNDIWFPEFSFEDIPCTPLLVALARIIIRADKPLINYLRNRPGSLSNDIAGISNISRTLKLLYERFQNVELLPLYTLELKKIFIGQFRFAYRKWWKVSTHEVKKYLALLARSIDCYYPDLSSRLLQNYYVFDNNEMLIKALDCVLPLNTLIVDAIESADTVISFEPIRRTDIRIICVKKPDFTKNESMIWGIAESIMEMV